MIVRMAQLVAAVLLAWAPVCASQARGSEDVTVTLFQTEEVQRLQIVAPHAVCRSCRGAESTAPRLVRRLGSGLADERGQAIAPVALEGEVQVQTGGGKRAEAAGKWKIDVAGERIRVQVTLTRERYVAAVLAAEAAPEEPPASLQALAVVARSFAAGAMHRHAGDVLCDSTHCQALRLQPVSPAIQEAVWATSGETLWYGGRRVPGYFSQHCGGRTEDASAAWGGPARPWLTAHEDTWCARVPAQWRAALDEPALRHALLAEGFHVDRPIRNVRVLQRDRSGRALRIELSDGFHQQTIAASTLRFALDRNLGWNQLRSDLYQVRLVGTQVVFEGAGHGHGVGLCQAGATAMARAGRSKQEILRMYFPGASVAVDAPDADWSVADEGGFTLRSTRVDAALRAQAQAAFRDARSRWQGTVPANVEVTVFPATESFRQATGQPGWDLAVTRGARIATQPAAVLRSHGGGYALLRHEFLHTFVESQSGVAAPLWLREGLVEVLEGERCQGTAAGGPQEVERSLYAPASLVAARAAHRNACVLARDVVRQRGMDGTLALLRQGR